MSYLISAIGFLNIFFLQSQSSTLVHDFMRSTGKIWVVVASILIIFVGIVFFLYLIEKKISKIEKEIRNEQKSN